MADKLHFSLVSPEAELFTGEVDQVDIPGTEGDFSVLPKHSPVMAAIRTGSISVTNDSEQTAYFVQGGFADVTPEGLTILAEKAVPMSEMSSEMLKDMIEALEKDMAQREGEVALAAQQNLTGLRSLTSRFEDFYHS